MDQKWTWIGALKELHIYILTCKKSTTFEKYKFNLKRIKTIPFLCTAKALHNEQFTAIKTSSPFLWIFSSNLWKQDGRLGFVGKSLKIWIILAPFDHLFQFCLFQPSSILNRFTVPNFFETCSNSAEKIFDHKCGLVFCCVAIVVQCCIISLFMSGCNKILIPVMLSMLLWTMVNWQWTSFVEGKNWFLKESEEFYAFFFQQRANQTIIGCWRNVKDNGKGIIVCDEDNDPCDDDQYWTIIRGGTMEEGGGSHYHHILGTCRHGSLGDDGFVLYHFDFLSFSEWTVYWVTWGNICCRANDHCIRWYSFGDNWDYRWYIALQRSGGMLVSGERCCIKLTVALAASYNPNSQCSAAKTFHQLSYFHYLYFY